MAATHGMEGKDVVESGKLNTVTVLHAKMLHPHFAANLTYH